MLSPSSPISHHSSIQMARSILRNPTFWALLGAILLAALYGRVALLNLTAGVVGGDSDGYQNLWNNYWIKTALLDLHTNPLYTDHIYYPTGASLRFHTLNLLNGLLTMPLNLAWGYVPGINLLFVAALGMTAFFCFLLLRDLVGNGWAAFAGAAIFTFANPRVVLFFNQGQSEKLSAQWLPLYLFFLFRALRAPSDIDHPVLATRYSLFASGAAILTLLLASLTDWQYVMYAVLVTMLYFIFILFTRRTWAEKRQIFTRLAIIGGGYAIIAGPFLLLPMVREAAESPWLSVSYQSQLHALDLLDILGMGLGNPGYLALLLAGVGLWMTLRNTEYEVQQPSTQHQALSAQPACRSRDRESVLFWAFITLFGFVMALGPTFMVGGNETGVPLPYGILQNLPVFSIGRDPGRFTTLSTLGVGVLAAFGLRALLGLVAEFFRRRSAKEAQILRKDISHSASSILHSAALTGLFLLITLWPFVRATGAVPVDPPDWPPFYQQIANDPDDYAILELPAFTERGRGESYYMALQSLHGKPRFSGRLARDRKLTNPNNFIKRASLFRHLWLLDFPQERRQLLYPERDFLTPTDYEAQGLAILNYFNVRYIVVYERAITDSWDKGEFARIIGLVLGPAAVPVYTDDVMRVYRAPQALANTNPLTLDVGDGWFGSEIRGDGKVFRLANVRDELPTSLYAMNLTRHTEQVTLRFTIYAFQKEREITVSLGGAPIQTLPLRPDPQQVELGLMLQPGLNAITFTTPEPPLPTGNLDDPRLLSFGMYDVAITR